MKRTLVCFTLISIALLSCKKDKHNQTYPQGKLYPVTFNISEFTQANKPISQSNKTQVNAVVPPEQSNILKILYKLYDSNSILKKTIMVKKGQPAFGSIKDSIASGSYTAVFVGITDTLRFEDKGNTLQYGGQGFAETYYKKISFVIGSQYLQQDVVLQRINSQVQIIIKDVIPAGVTYIILSIDNVNTAYSFLADTSSSRTSFNLLNAVTPDKIGTTNFTIGPVTILNTNSPVTISLRARDVNNKTIAQKTIYSVMLQRNTRTIVTGNMFTNGSGTNGFTITYNQTYNPGINQGF